MSILNRPHPEHRSAAFTLVELLVVVGVVALLLALLTAGLRGARGKVDETKSLSNVRTLVQYITMYTDRHNGTFPWLEAGQAVPAGCPGATISDTDYWVVTRHWPGVIDDIVHYWEHPGVFVSPGARTSRPPPLDFDHTCGWPTSYVYSSSFVASPQLWSGRAMPDERLLQPTRLAQVRYPSNKVILWDDELAYLGREPRFAGPDIDEPTATGFVDGHAALRVPSRATQPVPNVMRGNDTSRLHNTRNGVAGRDY